MAAGDMKRREAAAALLRDPSLRGTIDPFMVMDVMQAAAAKEAAGAHVIHMEVGQPATPAPKAADLPPPDPLNPERWRQRVNMMRAAAAAKK